MERVDYWKEQAENAANAISKARTLADMIGEQAVRLFPERSQLKVVENIQNMAELLYSELGYVHGTISLIGRELGDLNELMEEAEKR